MGYGYYSKVEISGVDTAHLKTLSAKEKEEYLKRMKEGDPTARQKLIDGNLRLVLSIVQRFAGRGENPDDLFQIGCLGLMKAIDHFDIHAGVQLSTYAVPMIIGEIRRYIRDNNAIRVSRGVRDLAYRALQKKEELCRAQGKEPMIEQIAQALDVSPAAVSNALEAIVEPISLYEPIYNDGGDSIAVMDQISDVRNTDEHWLEGIALREAMKKLNEREKKIIGMRYYSGRTQMEIAEQIGISQAQVSRLEKVALEKLRKQM